MRTTIGVKLTQAWRGNARNRDIARSYSKRRARVVRLLALAQSELLGVGLIGVGASKTAEHGTVEERTHAVAARGASAPILAFERLVGVSDATVV